MKRFTWTPILAAAMLMGAISTADAAQPGNKAHVTLYPPAGSPFPQASGSVTLSLFSPPAAYWLDTVAVSKLAPNASYYMPLQVKDFSTGQWVSGTLVFQTDSHGSAKVSVKWLIWFANPFLVVGPGGLTSQP